MSRRLTAWAGPAALAAMMASNLAGPAIAAEGRPHNWELNFQDAATPIAQLMHNLNSLLLAVMAAIVALVLVLLVWVMFRYNEKANPVPSTFTHNTTLEIVWTLIPILILIGIAVPSFKLLYVQYGFPKADLTIKATGHQWYWTYTYPDYGNFSYDSLVVFDSDLKPGQPRLLSVDNEAVVPVGETVDVLITADDVIHSWAIPSFGIKVDAVPGRVARTWFKALEPGVYYGQCSQLCGTNHAFMPIAVRVLSEPDFKAWLQSKTKTAANNQATKIAARQVR
jgi:cytochrome c oxidase subunit II